MLTGLVKVIYSESKLNDNILYLLRNYKGELSISTFANFQLDH
jgi:hypothetical protein